MFVTGLRSVAPVGTFCSYWFIYLLIAFKLGVVSQVGGEGG